MPRMFGQLTAGLLLVTLLVLTGCGGTYDARLAEHKTDLFAGRGGTAGANSGAPPVAAGTISTDPLLYGAPYEITLPTGTATGVKLQLPKPYVKDNGAADFANTDSLGGTRVTPANADTSLMTHFYQDGSGKMLPVIIIYTRVTSGVQDTAARLREETNIINALPEPKPAFVDFTTPSGTFRKLELIRPAQLPVGSVDGPKEQIDAAWHLYNITTTKEVVSLQIMLPNSAINSFDYLSAMNAGMKAINLGPNVLTGPVQ